VSHDGDGGAGRWGICWPVKMAGEAVRLFRVRFDMHNKVRLLPAPGTRRVPHTGRDLSG
jgi:hypothetical protein